MGEGVGTISFSPPSKIAQVLEKGISRYIPGLNGVANFI